MAELVCVPPERVAEMWPHARAYIKAAIDRTGLSKFEDIEREILGNRQLLWLAWDGATIKSVASTAVEDDALVIVACGGTDSSGWLSLISQIEDYAKSIGCRRTRIYGRRGWVKLLPEYQTRHVILERLL